LTVGVALATPSTASDASDCARGVPGSISIVMSLSGVRGRTTTCASVLTSRCGSSLASIAIETSARPSRSSTLETSPTRTPATVADWPWPGVSAWPVGSSTFSV
jgi:hypothetical protein